MENKTIIRFSKPHNYEPYGTICYVLINEDIQDVYVSISEDPHISSWVYKKRIMDTLSGATVSFK